MIDHTNLMSFATKKEISKLCREAIDHGFAAVCVNTSYVSYCDDLLKNSDVEVAAVVGFPLGVCTSKSKSYETHEAVKLGATEIDMVMNVGLFRDEDYSAVINDIETVVKAADGASVKVILETGYLTDEQIVKACKISQSAGAHFVKTSTGFGPMGAFIDHVSIMRKTIGTDMGLKAAGGIRNAKTAVRLINAGANRLGASAGIAIIDSLAKTIEQGEWFDSTSDKPEEIYSWGAADPKKQPKDIFEYYNEKGKKF
ncbi:MAG: deoxyribose-phosphate aldolase [Candidatus Heimdallarchaeota archaeon]|nr:deoxyribose-phosphate aldolase [Candidatus Heimdallarchaeota archaeon]